MTAKTRSDPPPPRLWRTWRSSSSAEGSPRRCAGQAGAPWRTDVRKQMTDVRGHRPKGREKEVEGVEVAGIVESVQAVEIVEGVKVVPPLQRLSILRSSLLRRTGHKGRGISFYLSPVASKRGAQSSAPSVTGVNTL